MNPKEMLAAHRGPAVNVGVERELAAVPAQGQTDAA